MRQPAQSQCELNPWGAPNGIALASTYREDRLGDCIAGCRRPASPGRQRRRQTPPGKGSSPRVGRAACQEAPQEIHSVASPSPAADTGCLPRTPRAWLEFVPHCTGRGRIGFFFLEQCSWNSGCLLFLEGYGVQPTPTQSPVTQTRARMADPNQLLSSETPARPPARPAHGSAFPAAPLARARAGRQPARARDERKCVGTRARHLAAQATAPGARGAASRRTPSRLGV